MSTKIKHWTVNFNPHKVQTPLERTRTQYDLMEAEIAELRAEVESQQCLITQLEGNVLHQAEKIAKQMDEIERLKVDAARYQVGLRFYANSGHYSLDEEDDFDTVSGEPENWLCSGRADSATMVEDGTIAQRTLRGEAISWEMEGDDCTPQPIGGESLTPGQSTPTDWSAA